MQVERSFGASALKLSGGRVSNTWITCPLLWDNRPKGLLIPDELTAPHGAGRKGAGDSGAGRGGVRGPLAGWRGKGPPRRRWVAGLRGRPATLGLRHGPDSYGRQQSGILHNGRKADAATPRERRRPSGCKALLPVTKGPVRKWAGFDGSGRGSPGKLRASSRGNT